MSDYNALGEPQLGVDKVATSPTAYALYDNPIAIAEGADGAPRIRPKAVAGTEVAAGTTRTVFLSPLEHRTYSKVITDQAGIAFAYTIAQTGTIRFSFQHAKGGEGGEITARVYRNETQIAIWDSGSNTYTTRTITSLSVAAGDRLLIRHSVGATPEYSSIRNIMIQTTGDHVWLLPYGMRVD